MVVLSRKIGENLQIGQDLTVTVLEIRGRQVSLAIDSVPDIHSSEMYHSRLEGSRPVYPPAVASTA